MDELYSAIIEAAEPHGGLLGGGRVLNAINKIHQTALDHGWEVWYRTVRMREAPHTVSVTMRVTRGPQSAYTLWVQGETRLRFSGGSQSLVEPGRDSTFKTQKSFVEFLEAEA